MRILISILLSAFAATATAQVQGIPASGTQGGEDFYGHIAVDSVDHRLFLNDAFGNRVLVFQLDRMNRLQEQEASWVIGQTDSEAQALLQNPDASALRQPMVVEYDTSYKRLFVADSWNNRVLVFDMTPGQVESGMAATHVLGQENFAAFAAGSNADRINFGLRNASGFNPSGSRKGGMALDKINQRLFVADSENNRVLVFDIHPRRIQNGADAIGVIGQNDSISNAPGLTSSKFALPGDMVMDEQNQRLFVELPSQSRILVFNVAPANFANGLAASYVIGQPRFTAITPSSSRSATRQPDGISYDPLQSHLYVTEKFNNHILTFDVHPDRMSNMPSAIKVIEEQDFELVSLDPEIYQDHQEVLFDPRGNVFDAGGSRLIQSEGSNSRINVFSLPRENFVLDLPEQSRVLYTSLDAYSFSSSGSVTEGYAVVTTPQAAGLVMLNTHYLTSAIRQEGSRRLNRELESVAMLPAGNAVSSATYYVEASSDYDVLLSFVNDNFVPASVEFSLLTQDGQVEDASRTILSTNQLSLKVSELFAPEELSGVLTLTSSQPVFISALFEVDDGQGQPLLAPVPGFQGEVQGNELLQKRRTLPAITTGAGSYARIVLINPGEEVLTGSLEITGEDDVPYVIEAGQAFVHNIPPDARPLLEGRAVARSSSGPAPETFALIATLNRDNSMSSLHTVSSHQEGALFWAPLDTRPNVLHSGNIDTRLHVVNDFDLPASIILELIDESGNVVSTVERSFAASESAILNMKEVFGENSLSGTLRLSVDKGISATLLETTRTPLGEKVIVDVPLQTTPLEGKIRFVFPLYRNGAGIATELLAINTDSQPRQGRLGVLTSEGEAMGTILR